MDAISLCVSNYLNWQIKLENRFKNDIGNDCLITIDGTDCPINEPRPFDKAYYSHKSNGPAMRYEVGVSILGGDIVWVNGPFRAGANPDLVIFKNMLMHLLEPHERVEADNGYIALDPSHCKTPKGHRASYCEHTEERMKKVASVARARQETANSRLKAFNILRSFRHDVRKHGTVFKAVVTLVQLSIMTDSPLFQVSSEHYNDSLDILEWEQRQGE